MSRRPTVLLVLLAAAALPAAGAGAAETVRRLSDEVSAAGARRVSIDAPVGELRIEGAATATVEVEVEVRCDDARRGDCRRNAERIELATAVRDEQVTVDVDGWPKGNNDGLSMVLRVTVPRDLPLVGELGVGELVVTGVEAGARLELGVGEMRVEVPAAGIGRAELEVGVGEAALHVGGRRIDGKGFLGREIDWTAGRGEAAIDAEVGVGEIEVRLVD
ncbi:MAG TPA: hypothetical protein VHM02_13130 [Thermoanaerobaculia bacterium]|nr:hypothetical protein [Thermoanaerobaculia bacterium]